MLVPQRYTERLGLIEPHQLQEVAAMHGLGEVREAFPPSSGMFGQNLVLVCSAGRAVLRGNPHGAVQLAKERCVARFVSERSSLPVPWPYRVVDDDGTFGWPYALLPLLPGRPGDEVLAALDDDGRAELAAAAGEALAELHDAEADAFGPYDAQLDDFVEMDDFADWVLYRLGHWRTACRAVNALSADAERFVDEVVARCSPALAEPFTPVLVHHDFGLANLAFADGEDGLVATGLFDLHEAYLGDGEEDLVRTLATIDADDELDAFVDAYTAAWPLREGAADRLELYALADRLGAWERAAKLGTLDEDAAFVAWVRPVLQRARDAAG